MIDPAPQPGPRPAFHVTPGAGWLNDPLGLTYHDGRYHLFYQHVPEVPEWDLGCHWGHVTSPDLLHWTEHRVALAPGEGDDGCWSGSVVVPPDGGPAAMFYTSVNLPNLDLGRARVAHPLDDGWDHWAKGDVVAEPPDDPALAVFRDPCVFRDGDGWRMLVGAAYEDGTAAALAYSSPDLATWTYDGPLAHRNTAETEGAWTGKGWECPQLLAVGDAHVLVFSTWEPEAIRDVACAVGTYADGRFTPRAWQQLAYGGHYAASAFVDAEGRPGVIFWIRGVRDVAAGWQGALSVPYVLSAADDGVRLDPHPAVATLRVAPGAVGHRAVGHRAVGHRALDVEWAPGGAGVEAIELRDGEGTTVVSFTAGPGWVDVVIGPSAAGEGQTLRVPRGSAPVRVVVDGPVLEVSTGVGLAGAPVVVPEGGLRCAPTAAEGLSWWALDPARMP